MAPWSRYNGENHSHRSHLWRLCSSISTPSLLIDRLRQISSFVSVKRSIGLITVAIKEKVINGLPLKCVSETRERQNGSSISWYLNCFFSSTLLLFFPQLKKLTGLIIFHLGMAELVTIAMKGFFFSLGETNIKAKPSFSRRGKEKYYSTIEMRI